MTMHHPSGSGMSDDGPPNVSLIIRVPCRTQFAC
jgi:hypothetical protein